MIFSLVYGIGIRIYYAAIWLASLWNSKAKDWIKGRKDWQNKLKANLPKGQIFWIHASSLGEYEMARPIIKALKNEKPDIHIVLSFFSPSGFNHFKDEGLVSVKFYLPLDTPGNAESLLGIVKPKAVLFIKYEFWPNLLKTIIAQKIPLFFAGVVFRSDQWFWNIPANPVLKILKSCTAIMVQNEQSIELAQQYGLTTHLFLTGDTRFDRAREVSLSAYSNSLVENFRENYYTIIVGSSWSGDEERYVPLIHKYPRWRWIITPHDVSESNVQRLAKTLSVPAALFTQTQDSEIAEKRVLLIDTVGYLSRLYRYADVALVGGAFGSGLHNIVEALAYGIPVLFGPRHHKFWEAEEAISQQFAHSYKTSAELEKWLLHYENAQLRYSVKEHIDRWFTKYTDATSRVIKILKAKEGF
ncbi:MAG: 3-deoxy-D-manno-octulosonic acid transferase [Thermaurantimonas sp.]|uniref:3-deoxy-D-manno-octulosonic acid transferase n=1 Tax=Thermaurantimonas sp. TaxID=2681568 RepID=UPI00391941B8